MMAVGVAVRQCPKKTSCFCHILIITLERFGFLDIGIVIISRRVVYRIRSFVLVKIGHGDVKVTNPFGQWFSRRRSVG
jgi:hypothetical protein